METRFRAANAEEISRAWGEEPYDFLVTPYRVYRPGDVEGVFLMVRGDDVALVTWSVAEAEIVSLDAFVEGRGYGTAAMEYAEAQLQAAGCSDARLHTTNPNVRAITLYLRRGYRVVKIHLDAMDRVRALKPGVPLEEHGLPLRDAWELVKEL